MKSTYPETRCSLCRNRGIFFETVEFRLPRFPLILLYKSLLHLVFALSNLDMLKCLFDLT